MEEVIKLFLLNKIDISIIFVNYFTFLKFKLN